MTSLSFEILYFQAIVADTPNVEKPTYIYVGDTARVQTIKGVVPGSNNIVCKIP